jgi:hypothetical protein
MSKANQKELLQRYYQHEVAKFKISDAPAVDLPVPSLSAFSCFQEEFDHLKKSSHGEAEGEATLYPAVKFITKNGESDGFVWHTTADKLQQAVRWGVVRAESVTGKVIGALGQYRLIAHERIMKGMISNTHLLKEKLLSHYQKRFELLQPLESWVNQPVPEPERIEEVIEQKIQFMQTIGNVIADLEIERDTFKPQFSRSRLDAYSRNATAQMRKDIQAQIDRLKAYRDKVEGAPSLRPFLRATGIDSALEIVKCEMTHSLYAMQGINQDCTYSKERRFAATRGELNSCIEDARKEVDEYRADLRNAISDKHHGVYGKRGHLHEEKVAYDFSDEQLSPEGERQALLAICFIEGYDKLDMTDRKKPKLISKEKTGFVSRPLRVVYATYWHASKDIWTYLKKLVHGLWTMAKSIVKKTRPWEKEFDCAAVTLREHAKPNDPLWFKPVIIWRIFKRNFKDAFKGLGLWIHSLFVDVPSNIRNDWAASDPVRDRKGIVIDDEVLIKKAEKKLRKIQAEEMKDLIKLLQSTFQTKLNSDIAPADRHLVHVDYHLTPGEQNDLLSAAGRGINEFIHFVSHNIFAKDPVAGAVYTSAYFLGAMAVIAPQLLASIEPYVKVSQAIGQAMGSSEVSAAIASAVTQAQLGAAVWNAGVHGPKSWLAQFTGEVLTDPVSASAYALIAFSIGYLLANGIAGQTIPGLSHFLQQDLGSTPEFSYPFITFKLYLLVNELLHSHESDPFKQIQLEVEEALRKNPLLNDKYKEIQKFHLVAWLSTHQADIPKLKPDMLFNIERIIRKLFTKEESDSLCKILYPEKQPSIAIQILAIPLNYIPAVARWIFSPFESAAAWFLGRKEWWIPMRNATTALFGLAWRDLTRLIVFTKEIVSAVSTIIATPIKLIANLLLLPISRGLALCGVNIGHDTHVAMGHVHVGIFRKVAQFFNPGRALKSVQVAHPNHMVRVIESSYAKRLETLLKESPEQSGVELQAVLTRAADSARKRASQKYESLFDSLGPFTTTPRPTISASRSNSSSSGEGESPPLDASARLAASH